MCDKKVLELIDYLYGNNIPPGEPKYKKTTEDDRVRLFDLWGLRRIPSN